MAQTILLFLKAKSYFMKIALPYFRLLLILLLYWFLHWKVLNPLDSPSSSSFNHQGIFFNRFLATLIILSGSLLLFKKTLWIGAWMSTLLVVFSFGMLLYANDLSVLQKNIHHHLLAFCIWLFGLIILWIERKNIPFIN